MLVPMDRLAAIAAAVEHARDSVFEATRGSTDPAAAEARSALVDATNQISRAARAPAWSFQPDGPVEWPVQIGLTLVISVIAGAMTYACRVVFTDPAVITIPAVLASIVAGSVVLDLVMRRFWPTSRPFHARPPARTDTSTESPESHRRVSRSARWHPNVYRCITYRALVPVYSRRRVGMPSFDSFACRDLERRRMRSRL